MNIHRLQIPVPVSNVRLVKQVRPVRANANRVGLVRMEKSALCVNWACIVRVEMIFLPKFVCPVLLGFFKTSRDPLLVYPVHLVRIKRKAIPVPVTLAVTVVPVIMQVVLPCVTPVPLDVTKAKKE
jgi:hypothetical protein